MTQLVAPRRRAAAVLLACVCLAGLASPVAAVVLQAQITKSFGAATIPLNGTTSLTFDLFNPNTISTLTNVSFSDPLPSGLVVSTVGTTDCAGTLTATTTSVVLSGASLGPRASCSVSGFLVKGTSYGQKDNSTTVTSGAGTGNTSTASVVVAAPPQVSAAFLALSEAGIDWAPVGSTVKATVGLENINTGTPLTGVGFSTTLPAGLTIANPNGLLTGGGCTAQEVTAVAGTHTISLSGATLAESSGDPQNPALGALCAVEVNVVASIGGLQTYSTGPVASVEGGNGSAASATLSVIGPGRRIYWGTYEPNGQSPATGRIQFDWLDGSVAANLGHSINSGGIVGSAIDAAAGRIYWGDVTNGVIRWSNLDDGTGGTIPIAGSDGNPWGLAIDPAAGRLYWASLQNSAISYADYRNGTAGVLYTSGHTGGATLAAPIGVAIDPASGRIYWANDNAGISYANLDGSGSGHDLVTTGATLNGPYGLALDTSRGLVYWANNGANKISYAHLDGSGGGDLSLPLFVNGPAGVAFDPTAHQLWWGNIGGPTISWANLDATGTAAAGEGAIATNGVTPIDPTFPSLLFRPASTAAPTLSGSGKPGVQLSCSKGAWATDLLGASLYRAPQSFAYAWQRNGTSISGALASTYTPSTTGDYTCTVTASNASGPTTSAPSNVADSLPPTVSAPTAAPSIGSSIGSTIPIKLRWSGADAGSGIGHYEVWLSTNGGSFVKVSSPTSATYTRSLTPSSTTTYRFRVRAFDKAGNVSGFAYGPTFHVTLIQQTSTSVHWSGTWTTASTSSASGGSYRYASTAGASVSYTFTGRAVGVVATVGTAEGSFNVYLDGVLVGTGSDYATSTAYRRLVYSKTWSSSATHTIKLVCVGTAGHPRIDVDAFVVLR